MWMKVGIDPRRSSSVCNFTAALVERNGAHGKHRQAQIDGRGIQGIDRIGQIDAEGILVDIERASGA